MLGGPSLGDSPEAIPTRLARGEIAGVVILDGAPDTVEKTLKALIRGKRFIQDKSNQASVIQSLKKWLRIPPTQNIEDIYDPISQLYDRTIAPTRPGIQNALRVLSKADPKFTKLKADDLVGDRIARKLEKEGF